MPEVIPNVPIWKEDIQKQAELKKMKFRATGLFVGVTLVFSGTYLVPPTSWIELIRATSEAAMVGALADWFAITALFKHPLGLKIPHTAIIPSKKDLFGDRLGGFIQQNFLSDHVVGDRIRSINVAQKSAQWLSQPGNSRHIADLAVAGMNGLVQIVKDEDIQNLIERGLVERIQSVRIAPVTGKILERVATGHKQQKLLIGVLHAVRHLVVEHEEAIRRTIVDETPWWIPWTIDETVYGRIIDSLEHISEEVENNPNHKLYTKFNGLVNDFITDLQHTQDVIDKGERLKVELLEHPIVREFSIELWDDIKTALLEHASSPDSGLHASIQQGVEKFGATLSEDRELQKKLNTWMEDGARYLVRVYGHEIGHLISQTVRAWDAGTTSKKIEVQVGKDLQFIRINGTIVGGMAGCVIHLISSYF